MSAIWKRIDEKDEGFTLIELLVVVIIIGILAAIAIPVFLNQREAAWKSQVESDLRNAAIAVETAATENVDGTFPDTDGTYPTAGDDPFEIEVSDGTVDGEDSTDAGIAYTSDGSSFQMTASHSGLEGEQLEYDSDAGGLQGWPDETD